MAQTRDCSGRLMLRWSLAERLRIIEACGLMAKHRNNNTHVIYTATGDANVCLWHVLLLARDASPEGLLLRHSSVK